MGLSTALALLDLIRGHRVFWAWWVTYLVVTVTGGHPPLAVSFTSAFAIAAIVAGGYALNDYFDIEVDRVNDPRRPLPSGRISPRAALAATLIAFTLGLSLSAARGPACLSVALADVALLVFYNRNSKRLGFFKTITVCALYASIFAFSAFAVGRLDAITVAAGLYAVLAIAFRECIKDMHDLRGDIRHAGARTPAILLGETRLRRGLDGILACAVLLGVACWAIGVANVWMLVLLPAAGAVLYQGSRAPDRREATRLLAMAAYLEVFAIMLGFNY